MRPNLVPVTRTSVLSAFAVTCALGTPPSASAQGAWMSALDHLASGASQTTDPAWARAMRRPLGGADTRFAWRQSVYEAPSWSLWTGLGAAWSADPGAPLSAGNGPVGFHGRASARLLAGGEWKFAPGWRFIAELDAGSGNQGRSVDAGARVQWDLSPQWYVGGGWRVLDLNFDSSRTYGYGRFSGPSLQTGLRF